MEIDRTKQDLASEKMKKLLQEKEEQRAAMRLEKCLRTLLQGDIAALNNDEVINNLPSFLYVLYEDGEAEMVFEVLETLSNGSCDSDRAIRERSVMVLSVFIGIVMQKESQGFDEIFSKLLVRWLKEEQEFLTGFETVCNQLQQQVKKKLDAGQWVAAENLLIVLYQIAAGIVKKPPIIKTVVNRTLNQLGTEELINRLLEEYLTPDNESKAVAESLLIHLGTKSLNQLVRALCSEEDAERRFLLLELLPNNEQVYCIMKEQLQGDVQWYVIRNAIFIFSRESSEENFLFIRQYADYPDMRVQQQVISGIWKMGGRDMILRLLYVLRYVDDALKMQLINQLGQMKKEPVIGLAFVYLLRQRHTFGRIARDELELALCEILGDYPLIEARDILTEIIQGDHHNVQTPGTGILAAAKRSLHKITEVIETDSVNDSSASPNTATDQGLQPVQDLDDLLHLGDEVDDEEFLSLELELDDDLSLFATDDQTDDGIGDELLEEDDAFQLILEETRKNGPPFPDHDFEVEEAQAHLSVWSDFYDRLDSEEFTTFYSLLEKKEFQPQQELVVKGEKTRQLILVDDGVILPAFGEQNDRVNIKPLQGGNMIGSASFFGQRTWPFTLVCQDIVRCHILDHERCQEFLDHHPAVYEKLKSYCKSHDVLSWLLEMLENHEPAAEKVMIYHMGQKLGGKEQDADDQPGEGLCYGAITGGLCLEIEPDNEQQCRELTAKLVEAVLCDGDEKCTKVFGVIAGWQKVDRGKAVRILVQFYRPYRAWEFTCRSLTFL